MDQLYSRKIKKNGLFYYRRKVLMAKWAKEREQRMQSQQCTEVKIPHATFKEDKNNLSETKQSSASEENWSEDEMSTESDTRTSSTDVELIKEDAFHQLSTTDALRQWALQTNQSHASIDLLLKVLKPRIKDCVLPLNARTLLRTNTSKVELKQLGTGEYWFNGLNKCIKTIFNALNKDIYVSINVNIDGLPVHKSSRTQLWPILFNVLDMPEIPPMPIAIYSGDSKPSDLKDFLDPIVEELNFALANGIKVNDHTVFVQLRCLICDSPARAFIKGVANFNSIHGCLKCTCEGQFSHLSNTVIFPFVTSRKRTDSEFRGNQYGLHHKCITPLSNILNLDLIEDIIVGDRLHLIDLGITKRLLCGWRDGKLGFGSKWRASQITEISVALQNVKFPKEIHRKSRGLDILVFWKASEFANFLHYSSITILKSFLSQDYYDHFLLYFCSVTILSCDAYKHLWHIAGEMLSLFVSRYATLYGDHVITSNVHNLLHVVDECEKFGNLNTISAYPFENALQQMKKLIRTGSKSLQQVVKRLSETIHHNPLKRSNVQISAPHIKRRGDRVWCQIRNFTLSNSPNNNFFMLNDKTIAQFSEVLQEKHDMPRILCFICQLKQNYFEYPFTSSTLNIYECKMNSMTTILHSINPESIFCKLVVIRSLADSNIFIAIPLLHTIN